MKEKLVVFELNNEAYGVDVAQVQSIIPMQRIVSVPGTPSFIEGVVNLRGAVIPVANLRRRFNLPQPPDTDPESADGSGKRKAVIVIVELDELQVGLIVDKVTEVTTIPEAAIEPPSPLLTSVDTAYLRGIGKFKEEGEKTEVKEPEEEQAKGKTKSKAKGKTKTKAKKKERSEAEEAEGRMVILLDLAKVFSLEEQQALVHAT
jgi:purine-binding chemotaxis protein CheW